MFPKFQEFREICEKLDPHGLFRNEYVEKVIFGSASLGDNGTILNATEESDRQSVTHTVDTGL